VLTLIASGTVTACSAVAASGIARIVAFNDPGLFVTFGLPGVLPAGVEPGRPLQQLRDV